MSSSAPQPEKESTEKSLFALLREIPGLFMDLLRAEFEQFKREMARKLKNIGVGSLLIFIALILLSYLTFTLLLAAVLGLATVMPGWAAALVVSGAILLIVLILVGIAAVKFSKVKTLVPEETIDSIVKDSHAIKGERDVSS